MTDWADEKARAWWRHTWVKCGHDHYLDDKGTERCLAALLREVDEDAHAVVRMVRRAHELGHLVFEEDVLDGCRQTGLAIPAVAERDALRDQLAKLEAVAEAARDLRADVLPPPHPPHHADDVTASLRVIRHDRARRLHAAIDALDEEADRD